MFGLGYQELLLILVIVLILFGAQRLPDLARSLGSSWTITSYSLLSRVKVLTLRPPSMVCSVLAIASTGTPRSSARSRSK